MGNLLSKRGAEEPLLSATDTSDEKRLDRARKHRQKSAAKRNAQKSSKGFSSATNGEDDDTELAHISSYSAFDDNSSLANGANGRARDGSIVSAAPSMAAEENVYTSVQPNDADEKKAAAPTATSNSAAASAKITVKPDAKEPVATISQPKKTAKSKSKFTRQDARSLMIKLYKSLQQSVNRSTRKLPSTFKPMSGDSKSLVDEKRAEEFKAFHDAAIAELQADLESKGEKDLNQRINNYAYAPGASRSHDQKEEKSGLVSAQQSEELWEDLNDKLNFIIRGNELLKNLEEKKAFELSRSFKWKLINNPSLISIEEFKKETGCWAEFKRFYNIFNKDSAKDWSALVFAAASVVASSLLYADTKGIDSLHKVSGIGVNAPPTFIYGLLAAFFFQGLPSTFKEKWLRYTVALLVATIAVVVPVGSDYDETHSLGRALAVGLGNIGISVFGMDSTINDIIAWAKDKPKVRLALLEELRRSMRGDPELLSALRNNHHFLVRWAGIGLGAGLAVAITGSQTPYFCSSVAAVGPVLGMASNIPTVSIGATICGVGLGMSITSTIADTVLHIAEKRRFFMNKAEGLIALGGLVLGGALCYMGWYSDGTTTSYLDQFCPDNLSSNIFIRFFSSEFTKLFNMQMAVGFTTLKLAQWISHITVSDPSQLARLRVAAADNYLRNEFMQEIVKLLPQDKYLVNLEQDCIVEIKRNENNKPVWIESAKNHAAVRAAEETAAKAVIAAARAAKAAGARGATSKANRAIRAAKKAHEAARKAGAFRMGAWEVFESRSELPSVDDGKAASIREAKAENGSVQAMISLRKHGFFRKQTLAGLTPLHGCHEEPAFVKPNTGRGLIK